MKEFLLLMIIGIVAIMVLQIIALIQGINGQVFSLAIGGICVIMGYGFKHYRMKWKYRSEVNKYLKKESK